MDSDFEPYVPDLPEFSTWGIVRTPEDLGKYVSGRRSELGWTQVELSEHLGFPVRYLHEIEAGKETLAFTRLFDLLRTLGVEVRLQSLAGR